MKLTYFSTFQQVNLLSSPGNELWDLVLLLLAIWRGEQAILHVAESIHGRC